jgi:hypothetical protein
MITLAFCLLSMRLYAHDSLSCFCILDLRRQSNMKHNLFTRRHGQEAFHVGEFGMVGFQNGNFWSNAVAASPGVLDSLPHAELLSHVAKLADEDYPDCPSVQEWCSRHGISTKEKSRLAASSFSSSSSSRPFFESRVVHQLCATVLQQQQQQQQQKSTNTGSTTDVDKDKLQLKEFAEQVAESEVRILLAHALERAGFGQVDTMLHRRRHQATPSSSTTIATPANKVLVDVDIAIGAARRVSSAHLGIFQSSGAVTVRSAVLIGHQDMDNIEKRRTAVLSAASGLACRLLEAGACRLVAQSELLEGQADGDLVEIVVSSGKSAGQVHYGNAAGGGDLAFGDVLARRRLNKATGQCSDSPSFSLQGDESFVFTSARVEYDYHDAVFVDPLFGSRGETPTTVVEWSKGTIHYSTQGPLSP